MTMGAQTYTDEFIGPLGMQYQVTRLTSSLGKRGQTDRLGF